MYFWPKKAKTAKTRIFPDTKLPLDDTKQLSPVSDQVVGNFDVSFWKKVQKPDFESKNCLFLDQKGTKMGPKSYCQNFNFSPFLFFPPVY